MIVRALPFLQDFVPQDTTAALPDTAAVADTVAVAPDTNAVLFPMSDPSTWSGFWEAMRENLLNADLWLAWLGTGLRIFLILFLAWIIIRLFTKVSKRAVYHYQDLPVLHPGRQRALTVSNLLDSTLRYVVWPIAFVTVLSEVGVNVGALIATAGIAGLAIGFGAQTLVKDVISGVFLLFDDTIHVGDRVRIGADFGVVEHIGVRLIKLRKFDGELMMVPAGELRIFGNTSIGFMRAVVEVGVSYEQDVDSILPIVKRIAHEWAADYKAILLEEEPKVLAITLLGDSSVNLRITVQVLPGEQFAAERDLRLRLKREFDRLGIEIPFPRRTIYMRNEPDIPPRKIVDDVLPPEPPSEEPSGSD